MIPNAHVAILSNPSHETRAFNSDSQFIIFHHIKVSWVIGLPPVIIHFFWRIFPQPCGDSPMESLKTSCLSPASNWFCRRICRICRIWRSPAWRSWKGLMPTNPKPRSLNGLRPLLWFSTQKMRELLEMTGTESNLCRSFTLWLCQNSYGKSHYV